MTLQCSCCINVFGTVQGVGFRYGTLFLAKKLNICGTVENSPDASVLIHAQGPEHTLRSFIAQLEQGPTRAAHVTNLIVTWDDDALPATDFTII